jgi:hypothetical protein
MACEHELNRMKLRKKLAPCGKLSARSWMMLVGVYSTFKIVVKNVVPSKNTIRTLKMAK